MSKMAEIEIASFDDAQDPNNLQVGGLRLNSSSVWLKLPANIGWVKSPWRSSIGTCVKIKELLNGKFEEEIYKLQQENVELKKRLGI
jgi:hypothetical protein